MFIVAANLMPELPDITVYIEALEKRILGRRLERVRVASPFLLRTANPPLASAEGFTFSIALGGKPVASLRWGLAFERSIAAWFTPAWLSPPWLAKRTASSPRALHRNSTRATFSTRPRSSAGSPRPE